MQPAAKSISDTTVTKWSLELLGSVTGIEKRIITQSTVQVTPPGTDQPVLVRTQTPFDHAFDGRESVRWAALVGFILLFTFGTIAVQELKPRIGRLVQPTCGERPHWNERSDSSKKSSSVSAIGSRNQYMMP